MQISQGLRSSNKNDFLKLHRNTLKIIKFPNKYIDLTDFKY